MREERLITEKLIRRYQYDEPVILGESDEDYAGCIAKKKKPKTTKLVTAHDAF
jgi:hypothetical protein